MADTLHLDHLRIAQNGREMLRIDATIAPGEVFSVMGPSGIGKSTLLAAIIGMLPKGFTLDGGILLGRADITALPPERRHIGILFQDALLFPHLSVGGNLAFGLPRGGNRKQRVAEALDSIGLPGFSDRDPATLSGGQKARVALMRVLLSQPRALLLDEPFSRLDTELRAQVRDMVFTRARAAKLPVLLVTHDSEDARAAEGPVLTLVRPDA
ncbi:ATP-binding cassette domain-containing protein [Citreicella sp. C3M06]|uniref:ATP-binding cassette domain-containing protein n=1 Tax=Citreicella sp. C3M06 TaxID=2841564 RepID=UPI001C09E804|nr:ATP-binding cassette domain-containing protein [Citreicella sp. C3M06]MBU2961673.1 ATP-binding cassette domain-containing protein [Citreicella sp. C3M06]